MEKLVAKKYQEMIQYSGQLMEAHKEMINDLNVFPVPDGDTGSNMNMTIQSGVKAVSNGNLMSIDEVAKSFSKGLLMGARGNSGVILSQFFRGLSEETLPTHLPSSGNDLRREWEDLIDYIKIPPRDRDSWSTSFIFTMHCLAFISSVRN